MARTVNIEDAKNQLAELVDQACEGAEVVITEKGKPVAQLVCIPPEKRRVAGLNRGTIWTTDDFDDPVPNEFWIGQK
jgi:prevent-host-death family protein